MRRVCAHVDPITKRNYILEDSDRKTKEVSQQDLDGQDPLPGESVLMMSENLTVKDVKFTRCQFLGRDKVCSLPKDKGCRYQKLRPTAEMLSARERPVPSSDADMLKKYVDGKLALQDLINQDEELQKPVVYALAIMQKYNPVDSLVEIPQGCKVDQDGFISNKKTGEWKGVLRSSFDNLEDLERDVMQLSALNARIGLTCGIAYGMKVTAETHRRTIKQQMFGSVVQSFTAGLRTGKESDDYINAVVQADEAYLKAAHVADKASQQSMQLYHFHNAVVEMVNALKTRCHGLREERRNTRG